MADEQGKGGKKLPVAVSQLSNLVPDKLARWLDEHKVPWNNFLTVVTEEKGSIEAAAAADTKTLSLMPAAIRVLANKLRRFPEVDEAAADNLVAIFTEAQQKKAADEAKKDAKKGNLDRVDKALAQIPFIVQHEGDSGFFRQNLDELFTRLLAADEVEALKKALTESSEGAPDAIDDYAMRLIALAKIEDANARKTQALKIIKA